MKYSHTNLIARDWRRLADFYIAVFGCRPVPPERDLSGDWVERLTGVKGVRIQGVHLALPGFDDGPTLEIFQFEPASGIEDTKTIHRYGFGHIAFLVDDVETVLAQLIARGGSALGDVIQREYPGIGLLTAVYARDPEGNFIEIQNWRR